ncbi:MAG: hypothetical protein KF830_05185 [Planctomycetes bacterium]|nr:hypothetical protein [Planctomycetota bacterium]
MVLRRLILVTLAAAALAWHLVETHRLAELAGGFEVEARRARGATAAAEAAHAEATRQSSRLTAELLVATERLQVLGAAIEERRAAQERAAAAAAAAAARALEPMPVGVRLCLQALHECLRDEGFSAQRFLGARSLDDEGLHEVELLDLHADGLGATFVRAGRMVATLDRALGRLELRFFDGERVAAGERTVLPDDGWALVFAPVDALAIERRLPFLVRAVGEPVDVRPAAPTDVDPLTRRRWLERFDLLLAAAGGDLGLQVARFRGMADGWFLDAELIGTDDRRHVVAMASCKRLAVEVDAGAGVVSLLLREGSLRRGGVDSTITGEGYRMLLPRITPRQASDTMLGMVLTR